MGAPPSDSATKTTLVSDKTGMATSLMARGTAVIVAVLNPEWYCEKVAITVADDTFVPLTLLHTASIRLRAQFDDGSPVTHMGYLLQASAPDVDGSMVRVIKSGYSASFALSQDGTVTVEQVPVDNPLECMILPQPRPGYTTTRRLLQPHELASGAELLIVVSATDQFGTLRVDFTSGAPARGSMLVLEQFEGPTHAHGLQAGVAFWRSANLRPNLRYRVTVTGTTAWRSGWVDVARGQETVIAASLDASATVSARILDEVGKPLHGATLRLKDGRLVSYRAGENPVSADPTDARSNEAGEVELQGLPPGSVELELESWQYDVARRTVTVAAGGNVNLGDVSLTPAIGQISVELTGTAVGREYTINLGHPLGGLLVPPAPGPITGTRTFARIALRRYLVFVHLRQGGSVVSAVVELTPDVPMASITLDVSGLKP